jgi:hypothetical protein
MNALDIEIAVRKLPRANLHLVLAASRVRAAQEAREAGNLSGAAWSIQRARYHMALYEAGL